MAMTRVDVTFTEQRLRVQLNLQQVQGSRDQLENLAQNQSGWKTFAKSCIGCSR